MVNKNDIPTAICIMKKKKKYKTINISNKREYIITDPTDTKRIRKEDQKQIYVNKFDYLDIIYMKNYSKRKQ